MLRGEGPQAASDDSDSAEFGPGCVHHIGGGGVLLAQKSVFTISTLQIVLCAGYRDLHCFPGPAQGPLRTPQHRRSAEGEQLGDFCCLLIPLAPPSWMPSEESRQLTSEPTESQERLGFRTESRGPKEVNSQAGSCLSSWSADQPPQSSQAVSLAD